MASIKKIQGKNGVTYKITVCMGRDVMYNQVRHYKTWKPEPGMNARQAEKKAKQIAAEFEQQLEYGFQADNKQTFSEYAQYVIDQKYKHGGAKNTREMYTGFLKKLSPLIGKWKIRDIRPMDINAIFDELAKPGYCHTNLPALPRPGLRDAIIKHSGSIAAFSRECEACITTIKRACAGDSVTSQSAERIAATMGKTCDSLFIVNRTRETLSGGTLRRMYEFVNVIFSQAANDMIITINPVERVSPPKAEKHKPNYFQPEQVTAILEALEKSPMTWKTLVTMMIVTGARRGEIVGLKWDKVDFDNGQIIIDNCLQYYPGTGVVDNPTKTRKTRKVSVPPETMALLRRYRLWQLERRLFWGDQWKESPYVFTAEHGGPLSPVSVNTWLDRFAKDHGFPHINPHAFRHSAASIMIANGIDIVSVSKMLGHASPRTTMEIYSHEIDDATRNASECIADVILRKKA